MISVKIEKYYPIPGQSGVNVKVSVFFTGFVYIEFIGMPCELRAQAEDIQCKALAEIGPGVAELRCLTKTSSVPQWKLRLACPDADEIMQLIKGHERKLNSFKALG